MGGASAPPKQGAWAVENVTHNVRGWALSIENQQGILHLFFASMITALNKDRARVIKMSSMLRLKHIHSSAKNPVSLCN